MCIYFKKLFAKGNLKMKKLLVLILFLASSIGLSYSQENKDSSQYDSGMDQIIVPTQIITTPTDGDTLNTLVNAEGQEASIIYNNGVVWCNEGNYDDAIGAFGRALEMNPEIIQAYYGRGTCYIQQKKYNEAINDLKQYIKRKQDNYASYLIGYCYFHIEDIPNATYYFQDAIEKGCNKADLFYHLGVINFNNSNYDEAIKYYTRAIEIDDTHAFSYNDRGSSYRMMEKYDRAINDYKKAIELNPNMDIFRSNLGSVYRINKDYEKALEIYDEILKKYPDNYIVLNNKGATLYEMRDYDKAIESLNECLKQKKDYAYAYNNLGLCYYRKKDYTLAIEAFTKAIALNPQYGEAYESRGTAREMSRDSDGACSDWETAKSLGINLDNYVSYCNE